VAYTFMNNVWLPEAEHVKGQYRFGKGGPFMTGLAKVNVFVGPNNSGKSRLLRAMLQNCMFLTTSGAKHKDVRLGFEQAIEKMENQRFQASARAEAGLDSLKLRSVPYDDRWRIPAWTNEAVATLSQGGIARETPDLAVDSRDNLLKVAEETVLKLVGTAHKALESNPTLAVYIPTLRGLRRLSTDDGNFGREQGLTDRDDVYAIRTRHDYPEVSPDKQVQIFTGLSLYQDVRNHLLDVRAKRDIIREYEDFLKDTFFNGRTVSMIPKTGEDVLYIGLGDEEEFPIYNLGDGLQHTIVMTYPVFMHKGEPLLLFIEEPELYLHPGMQRQLLELFARDDGPFAKTQIFLTTHSNHFLDLTLETGNVSVYRFSKQTPQDGGNGQSARFRIENVSNADCNVLSELGVRNSSVFLTNCTVWVEGITDRMYIRKYLELHAAEFDGGRPPFREDTHYTIAEYAGANIDHWLFGDSEEADVDAESEEGATKDASRRIRAERLCGTALVIADKDERKEDRHERRKRELGERYIVLDCREIENLLAPKVLVEVVASWRLCGGSDLEEPLSWEHYKDELLGKYIDEDMFGGKPPRQFAADSGTLKEKLSFAKKACNAMESWDDLTPSAQGLAKTIVKFIEGHNS
jgi:AAA domain, putative AbiEii toxin, Type IV TA system